ncbi:hypothetical protein Tco_1294197 [Tanacetum coccineum]
MSMYTLELSLSLSILVVRKESPVEEAPARDLTRKTRKQKTIPNDEDKRCIAWIVEKEIALCKCWVRISEDSVAGNSRKEVGFYIEILAKKKVQASSTSASFSNEDALARLMVKDYVDLTQTYKERKSRSVEAFLDRKRELQLREEEFKMRQMEQCRRDLRFYLQPTDHLSGPQLEMALDMKRAMNERWDLLY